MPERKVWTEEEDRVLKFLKQVRGVPKWSEISQQMEKQFNIMGRNGKQCRERYHNHLDKRINNSQWTLQQDNKLFQIQDEVGNKWALISSKLPGRSDNCVKNHFYSKLRKGMRKLNKKIQKYFKRQYKEIKTATLYRIIENIENKGKANLKLELDSYQLCKKIKNQLKDFQSKIQTYQNQQDQLEYIKHILDDIAIFDVEVKKSTKKIGRKSSKKQEDEDSSYKTFSNNVSSSKSVYDQEQSFTNSQLYSSESFDQSYRSNPSEGLLRPPRIIQRSYSIKSQTEEQQNFAEVNILYKSANNLTALRQRQINRSQANSNCLKVPSIASSQKRYFERQMAKSARSKSESSQSQKIFECKEMEDNLNMIGEQQNFPSFVVMRLFSPKKPTHDDIMEMNEEIEQIFYEEKMEIDCDNLVQNFSGLGLEDIPRLGHSFDF